MLRGIRFFKTPVQKSNLLLCPQATLLSNLCDTALTLVQNTSSTMSMCHSDMLFSNTVKLDTVYNAKNRSCQGMYVCMYLFFNLNTMKRYTCIYTYYKGIHDAITTKKNREPFDLIVNANSSSVESTNHNTSKQKLQDRIIVVRQHPERCQFEKNHLCSKAVFFQE